MHAGDSPLHISSDPEHERLKRQHDTLVSIMNILIVHAHVTSPEVNKCANAKNDKLYFEQILRITNWTCSANI